MKNNGYIRLDRCIAESRWFKNVSTSHLFIYLLLKANFEKGVFEENTIKRGQLVTSLKHLSEDTDLSLQQVRTALKHLKSTHTLTNKQQQYNKDKKNNKNNKDNKERNDDNENNEVSHVDLFNGKSKFND